VTVAHHLPESDIVYGRTSLAEGVNVFDVGDTDGRFAAGHPFRCRQKRFDKDGLGGGKVPNKFICFLFAHELFETRQPLGGGRMLSRIGHDDLAAKLGLNQIFDRLGSVRRLD
jgi:hypothetical protein